MGAHQDLAVAGSSPELRIAEVPAGPGTIGVTFCPGKQGPGQGGALHARSVEADVDAIRRWGASAVVTLIEAHEFRLLNVTALPDTVRAAGLEWHHLPIVDVSVPDETFERRWHYAGLRIRRRLRTGERVLVHCRGGLGRAGLVAASLLVELGAADPREAIARVRAVRPGAIETSAQACWVDGRRTVSSTEDERAARELGCLLGGAIGDALGARVEFDSLATIRGRHGPQGIRLADAGGPLVITDDTQMTLYTLEAMARARHAESIVEEIREAYLDWLDTQQHHAVTRQLRGRLAAHPTLRHSRAPGNTCLSALIAGGQGTLTQPINHSKGCGGVMRTAPIGFLGGPEPLRRAFDLGAAAAAITHGHPDGWAPAGVMAMAVRALSDQADWLAVVDAGIDALAGHPSASGTARLLGAARQRIERNAGAADVISLGEGWVGDEALAVGLAAAAVAPGFSEAVEVAANHDGDSDSTASIAGQLYGARHGVDVLPADAVYRLDVLDPLLEVWGEWAVAARAAAVFRLPQPAARGDSRY